jgi:hypothetical protein
MISQRTKEALGQAKAKGARPGNPCVDEDARKGTDWVRLLPSRSPRMSRRLGARERPASPTR